MNIRRSITIDQSPEKVFAILSDFNEWTQWSPWLIMDPEAKVNVAEDAKSYSWEGPLVGEGNMAITAEKEHSSIDYDLVFLKPWKSKAKVGFELRPEGKGTQVTWTMDSSLPFFMFWMKKMMEAFVGMDYERGLRLLKDYSEDGKVHSQLEFPGNSSYAGCNYIAIHTACTKDELADKMSSDFQQLWKYLEDKKDLVQGEGFSIYHTWDMVKGRIEYTSGVQVSEIPSDLPAGMISGKIPATPVHSTKHTGPYAHLGNAWSAMYNRQRNKVFKQNKKIDPFEVYGNKPGEVDDNELVTEVHFATR